MAKFCGGIRLGDTLKVENGVITVADQTDEIDTFDTPCGMLFDGSIFVAAIMDGNKRMLTSTSVEPDMDAPHPIRSNCGLWLDARYFTVEDGVVDFHERYLMEVVPTPANATVTVTHEGEPVNPFAGTLVYPMDEHEGVYSVTVSAEGYTEQTQEVEATDNQMVEIALTPV